MNNVSEFMMKWLSKKFKQLWCEATTACQPQKDSVFSATFHWLSIHWNVLWSETEAAAAPPVAQLSEVMQGFKVGCFAARAILASRGRAHQSYLSGGTKACLCSPQRGFFFCILVSSPSLPFSRFMLPVVLKEKTKTRGGKLCLKVKQNGISLHCGTY